MTPLLQSEVLKSRHRFTIPVRIWLSYHMQFRVSDMWALSHFRMFLWVGFNSVQGSLFSSPNLNITICKHSAMYCSQDLNISFSSKWNPLIDSTTSIFPYKDLLLGCIYTMCTHTHTKQKSRHACYPHLGLTLDNLMLSHAPNIGL